MTLMATILKKLKSEKSVRGKYYSPPPEITEDIIKKKKKYVYKYAYVKARVDSSPPLLQSGTMSLNLARWSAHFDTIYWQNALLVAAIKRQHFTRGKVDCWLDPPKCGQQAFDSRRLFLKRVAKDNKSLYNTLVNTPPKVATAESLRRDWVKNKRQIVEGSEKRFVLFDPMPKVDDSPYKAPEGVRRPKVYMELSIGGSSLGELVVELFVETCPQTCQLFLELLDGDGLGHGYVGTCFYTKVPNLYWAGGDVIYNNGFGCYAQRGRRVPIGAENYHFPHSAPVPRLPRRSNRYPGNMFRDSENKTFGRKRLLSMRMTPDNEMCGGFNILFKSLSNFDLRNVVFGRVIQPCSTYDVIRDLGSPLSSYPVVTITRARRRERGRWVYGRPNEILKRRYGNTIEQPETS